MRLIKKDKEIIIYKMKYKKKNRLTTIKKEETNKL